MEAVHFPGGNAGGQPSGDAVGPVGLTRQGGKCPDSGGKWFTFPEGMRGDSRLEMLWGRSGRHAKGEVPGFRGKTVHFPGGNTGGQPPGWAVGPVGQTRQGGSARIPGGNGSLSRRECRGTAVWRCCGAGRADTLGGKCSDSGRKWFTFPEGMPEEGCLEGMALFEVFYTVDVAWVVCRSH